MRSIENKAEIGVQHLRRTMDSGKKKFVFKLLSKHVITFSVKSLIHNDNIHLYDLFRETSDPISNSGDKHVSFFFKFCLKKCV